MPIYKHREGKHIKNPQKTGWLSLLPVLADKNVLKFGAKKYQNLINLIRCNCKTLTCVSENYGFTELPVNFINSLDDAKNNTFDLCILDELDDLFHRNPNIDIIPLLEKCFTLLNDNGILLVGFPNGLSFGLMHNYRIKNSAKHILTQGYEVVDSFICTSSFDNPIFIYPYSQDVEYTKSILIRTLFHSNKFLSKIKDFIKFLLIKTLFLFNPLFGVILVAYKNKKSREIICFEKVLVPNKTNPLYSIWLLKPFVGKHIGLVFNLQDKNRELVAVCKRANIKDHRATEIKNEHEFLLFLQKHEKIFYEKGILFPKPLSIEISNERITSIESAIKGIPLSYTGIPLKNKMKDLPDDLKDLKTILSYLVPMQFFIQKTITQKFLHIIPNVHEKYYRNIDHLTMPIVYPSERINLYRSFAQHGDYTLVNFLYNSEEKKFGVIDWEWVSCGYPPGFDLFYLFTSAGFIEKKHITGDMFERQFESFKNSFFSDNWFSDFVFHSIRQYFLTFEFDIDRLYIYFLDHLLFVYNKYRLDFNLPQFEKIYLDMVNYTIANKSKFLLKGGGPY